jgi:hypothetical protein
LVQTPLSCEYSPDRIELREGQHSELGTIAWVKRTPWRVSRRRTFGMWVISSARWSSESTSTMFGRCPGSTTATGGCGLAACVINERTKAVASATPSTRWTGRARALRARRMTTDSPGTWLIG